MKAQPTIAIIDYGVGNLYSLAGAFRFHGIDPIITEDPEVLAKADGVVIPGVGSFKAGMRGLQLRGLVDTVKTIASSNKPMLGICLGAQLMLSEGHEFGVFEGLGIMKGKVVRFPALADNEKIPQVGWNTVDPVGPGILAKSQMYFVHSYILQPESKDHIFALSTYGGHTFCSAIRKGNVYGFQFHPEKSGAEGLKLLGNFINLVKNT